ncbi:MAG: RNA-directed DNA polymerase [Bacteroidaceae bacterium]|nr:RNA-directed DNA polymerase [Bacteroidaceae bacterium]
MQPFILSREQLLTDLYMAYYDARRHKRNKPYQLKFEEHLEENLESLCDELYCRTYKPLPSTCFLISDPKKREVFAADFRDRIVHHLYYNYTHELFERTFIPDSYSCIKGRGTHFGIDRLEQHIRQESHSWQEPCWVLKMDIRGYFMHINRQRLLSITLSLLDRMESHSIGSMAWGECLDMDFLRYLTHEIVLLDPIADCRIKGSPADWHSLPRDKSLFFSPKGCGLPIGNLTSQLFSNVYLGRLDEFMKRTLRCRHYGRYVDDFYVVSASREWLHTLIPQVRKFLKEELDLTLHEGKVRICSVNQGVEFLGAYLKPHRRYVSNTTLRRMQRKLPSLEQETDAERLRSRIASFRGVLSHYSTGWLFLKPAFRLLRRKASTSSV